MPSPFEIDPFCDFTDGSVNPRTSPVDSKNIREDTPSCDVTRGSIRCLDVLYSPFYVPVQFYSDSILFYCSSVGVSGSRSKHLSI